MANIAITAANVLAGSNSSTRTGTAGEAITAGQIVYFDDATKTFKLADCNSATAAARSPAGVALNGGSTGQPLLVQIGGDITIGGVLTKGVAYYLSGTAGAICPFADLLAGDYPVVLGIAKSTTVLALDLIEAGSAI